MSAPVQGERIAQNGPRCTLQAGQAGGRARRAWYRWFSECRFGTDTSRVMSDEEPGRSDAWKKQEAARRSQSREQMYAWLATVIAIVAIVALVFWFAIIN